METRRSTAKATARRHTSGLWQRPRRRAIKIMLLLAMATGGAVAPAAAEDAYPSEPIRFIVGFPPGAGTDSIARALSEGLSEVLKVPVPIDYKPGASGTIATTLGANAKPDGHTITLGTSAAMFTAPTLMGNLAYDLARDLRAVGLLGNFPNVYFVPSASPLKTIGDIVAAAKRNPGKLTYGSAGVGSTHHLASLLLEQQAGIEMIHVPYNATGPVVTDLSEGRIDFTSWSPPTMAPLVSNGSLRAIASTGDVRAYSFPDVPTVAEQGFPGYRVVNWYALLVPAKTPDAVVDRLNAALGIVLNRKDLQERLAQQTGFIAKTAKPAAAQAFLLEERARWTEVLTKAPVDRK